MIARSLILSRPEKVDNIEVLNGSGAYSCLVLASRRRLKNGLANRRRIPYCGFAEDPDACRFGGDRYPVTGLDHQKLPG